LAPALIISAPLVVVGLGQKAIIMTSVDYQTTDPGGTSTLAEQQIVDQIATIYDTASQSVFSTTVTGGLTSSDTVGRVVEVTPATSPVTFSIQAFQSVTPPAVTANDMSIVVMVVGV
jgi:hypothetical protein